MISQKGLLLIDLRPLIFVPEDYAVLQFDYSDGNETWSFGTSQEYRG